MWRSAKRTGPKLSATPTAAYSTRVSRNGKIVCCAIKDGSLEATTMYIFDGPSGAVLRWRFSEITPDSFHWQGSVSRDGGATWRTQVELFAQRSG